MIDELQQFVLAKTPVDFLALLVTAARVANSLLVDKEVGLGIRHDATLAVAQHSAGFAGQRSI